LSVLQRQFDALPLDEASTTGTNHGPAHRRDRPRALRTSVHA
jgi:hypothetical protein